MNKFNDTDVVSNFSDCVYFPHGSDLSTIEDVKLAFTCVGILTSIIAVVLLIQKVGLLIFKIVFFAVVVNGMRGIVRLMEFFLVRGEFKVNNTLNVVILNDETRWSTVCEVLGFLGQTTDWMAHLCMSWVIVYLLYLLVKEKRLEEGHCSKGEIVGFLCAFWLLSPSTGFYLFTSIMVTQGSGAGSKCTMITATKLKE